MKIRTTQQQNLRGFMNVTNEGAVTAVRVPKLMKNTNQLKKFYHLIFLDVVVSVYMSSLEKEPVPNLLINCCKPSKTESEQHDRGTKNGTLAIFAGGDELTVKNMEPLFSVMGKVNYMGGSGNGQFAKLANQVTIASTMVGLVEGMVYAHKARLDVGLYLEAISTGATGSKSLDLYGKRILKRDFEAGFFVNHFVKDLGICLNECQNMGIALPGLALAQQLYLSLKAHGEGYLGTQALILVLE
ncbi:3-hydroxyisobutyrate dehydrogenase-like 1 [Vigna angularis]|uniref:3-hydroxyisobutyrate dehydrogenase-like 1 n=1 Tax=Phaseolus angularis TaxID=3914 RepID=A0A8T0KSQ2_PHAAN|nr:3-hydroxyisobutyrate dehydrogenase-like 1 [Vigna angularis]